MAEGRPSLDAEVNMATLEVDQLERLVAALSRGQVDGEPLSAAGKELWFQNIQLRRQVSKLRTATAHEASKPSEFVNTRLTRAAFVGDIDTMKQELDHPDKRMINAVNTTGNTALHFTIQQRKWHAMKHLLDAQANVNACNWRLATPLMVAATCHAAAVPILLAAGADATAKNIYKRTAHELAAKAGNNTAADLLLKAFEEQTAAQADVVGETHAHLSGDGRCPVCKEGFQLSNLRRVRDKVAKNDENNDYVVEFASSKAFGDLMKGGIHHRAIAGKGIRKEISESWGILKATQQILNEVGLDGNTVAFLDLCCGKSLNSTLLNIMYPDAQILACDTMNPSSAPHFSGQAEYVESDIFSHDFIPRIAGKLDRPTIVVGMHLCGALSPRAIQIFEGLQSTVGLVLSPCCLPSKSLLDVVALANTKNDIKLYQHWALCLSDMAGQCCSVNSSAKMDPNILSQRNYVIVSSRRETLTFPREPLHHQLVDMADRCVARSLFLENLKRGGKAARDQVRAKGSRAERRQRRELYRATQPQPI